MFAVDGTFDGTATAAMSVRRIEAEVQGDAKIIMKVLLIRHTHEFDSLVSRMVFT